MNGLNEQLKVENMKRYELMSYSFILEKWNTLDAAKFIAEKGLITQEELNNLVDIINSPDRENYELAKILITTKHQKYGK